MWTLQVEVTEDHIKKGRPCTSSECPVALALSDLYPDVYYGEVGISIGHLYNNDPDAPIIMLSLVPMTITREMIRYYDVREFMVPFVAEFFILRVD